jgi:hypothetical protein
MEGLRASTERSSLIVAAGATSKVRPGDIFVCTPAKCGTTWMQTIVVTLLFPHGDAPGAVWEIKIHSDLVSSK